MNDKNKPAEGKHEHPLALNEGEKKKAADAYRAAEKDIEQDPEISAHSPNDDLDEGETARLGDDGAGVI